MHARISYSGRLKTFRLPGLLATSLLFLSSLRAQDAKFAADNLKVQPRFLFEGPFCCDREA